MSVIDFDSGELTDEEVIVPSSEPIQQQPQQVSGGVINLDTGGFVSAEPVVTPEVKTEEEAGFFDILTGASRETEATRTLPEIGALSSEEELSAAGVKKDFQIAAGLLAAAEPQDQMDVIKSVIPEAKFEQDEKGNTIVDLGDGRRAILNKPGLSHQDLLQTTATILSFIPAAKIAGLGKTLMQKMGLGFAAASATEAGIQEVAVAAGAEEARDPVKVGMAGTFGAAGELVVPAFQAFRSARRAKAIGAETEDVAAAVKSIEPVTEAVTELEKATGTKVGVFQAQQTQIPSELLKQRILPQLDAGARKAASALETQNKEVFEATTSLINTIAPEGSIVSAAKRFREASKLAVESAKQQRSIKVAPLYDDALNLGADVDIKATSGLIDDILKDAPPGSDFEKVGIQLKNLISTKEGVAPSLRQLQKAKISMQDIVDGVGDKAVSGTIKGEVIAVKRKLVDSMTEASPLFKAAEEEFKRLSPAVKKLEDSILSNVSKVKDTQLKNIAQNIFDPKTSLTDPAAIIQARKAIDSVDPEAWDQLLRVEMQRRLGGLESLIDDIPGDFVGNIPGQLRRTLFGNPAQRKALLSGMSDQQKQSFKYLETVLKRASSGRAAGSPTAAFGQAIEKLKGVSAVVRDVIFRPLSTLQQTGERGIFDRNVAALTDVMFDPKFAPQMKKLTKLNPDSPAAARAMTQLLNSATSSREKEEGK